MRLHIYVCVPIYLSFHLFILPLIHPFKDLRSIYNVLGVIQNGCCSQEAPNIETMKGKRVANHHSTMLSFITWSLNRCNLYAGQCGNINTAALTPWTQQFRLLKVNLQILIHAQNDSCTELFISALFVMMKVSKVPSPKWPGVGGRWDKW